MTLKYATSRSSRIKVHSANRKPTDGFLSNFLSPTLYLSSYSRYLMRKSCDLHLSRFKVIQGQRSCCQSYLTCIVSSIVSLTVFEIFHAEVMWHKSKTVHGYPRSKFMMEIDNPWVISYSILSTSSSYLSPFFEIFDVQFLSPWTRTVQDHPRAMVMVLIGSPLVVSYMTSIVSNLVSATTF